MMARKTSSGSYTPGSSYARKTRSSGQGFEALVREVSVEQFVRMVTKSGLPTSASRGLCAAFKKLAG